MSNDQITKIVTALSDFFNSFTIPAYAEDCVPEEVHLPYITYQIAVPRWENPVSLYARVWYRSDSFQAISAKVGEIDAAIGPGFVMPLDGGAIWIYKGSPFAQFMPQPGDLTLKCMYLNMTLISNMT